MDWRITDMKPCGLLSLTPTPVRPGAVPDQTLVAVTKPNCVLRLLAVGALILTNVEATSIFPFNEKSKFTGARIIELSEPLPVGWSKAALLPTPPEDTSN